MKRFTPLRKIIIDRVFEELDRQTTGGVISQVDNGLGNSTTLYYLIEIEIDS